MTRAHTMNYTRKTISAQSLYRRLEEAVRWQAIRAHNHEAGGETPYAIREIVDLARGLLGNGAADSLAATAAREYGRWELEKLAVQAARETRELEILSVAPTPTAARRGPAAGEELAEAGEAEALP